MRDVEWYSDGSVIYSENSLARPDMVEIDIRRKATTSLSLLRSRSYTKVT